VNRDLTAPLPWVCSQCVIDGTMPAPEGPRTDGICGPHADFYYIDRWRRQAQRESAAQGIR